MRAFFHFLKYFLLAAFLFAFLNLFRSNADAVVSLKFDIPPWWHLQSVPLSINYLLLINFCVGILFAALGGALRLTGLGRKKKELAQLKQQLKSQQQMTQTSETLPSLVE